MILELPMTKESERNTQITLTATRVDQKRRKSVVHVLVNNMSHISIAIVFFGQGYLSPKELRADARAKKRNRNEFVER